MIEQGQNKIGQARVEYEDARLSIDIFLDPLYRSKNYGVTILELLKEHCKLIYPGVPLYAVVKENNFASLNLFRKANFQELKLEENIYYFIYKY